MYFSSIWVQFFLSSEIAIFGQSTSTLRWIGDNRGRWLQLWDLFIVEYFFLYPYPLYPRCILVQFLPTSEIAIFRPRVPFNMVVSNQVLPWPGRHHQHCSAIFFNPWNPWDFVLAPSTIFVISAEFINRKKELHFTTNQLFFVYKKILTVVCLF